MFSKLIRDADKLDILYVLGHDKYKDRLRQDDADISEKIKEAFYNNKSGDLKYVVSNNDKVMIAFCFIYDINFKVTLEKIKEEKYYEKIYKRISRKDIFNPYLEYVNKYLQEIL